MIADWDRLCAAYTAYTAPAGTRMRYPGRNCDAADDAAAAWIDGYAVLCAVAAPLRRRG